jgi:hypothetical protein
MTGNEGYPRDMIGNGRTPPFAGLAEQSQRRGAVRYQL